MTRGGMGASALRLLRSAAVPVVLSLALSLALPLALTGPLLAQGRGLEVASGTSAVLRGLDKVSGETTDMTLRVGAQTSFARLEITLVACRYPVDSPESDAFAFLEIRHGRSGEQLFRGWMIASSPALNALDDPRFDVWVLSCQ